MKKTILLFLLVANPILAQTVIYGLQWPANGAGAPVTDDSVYAIVYFDPQDNGLPIWGPTDAGVTYFWEYYEQNQQGYYTTFFWGNNGTFAWNASNADTYYGAHPYPNPASESGSVHYWEISASSNDYLTTRGDVDVQPTDDQWHTQALRVWVNGDNTKTLVFYFNLPDTSNNVVIEHTTASGFGETNPPNPCIMFGDACWTAEFTNERGHGILGRLKIVASYMSGADMLTESGDMTQLVTSVAQANIWYGKNQWSDDGGSTPNLVCDYGTGREFEWYSSTRIAPLAEVTTLPSTRAKRLKVR